MGGYASLNCFNAGELSPRMLGRNDVSQYGKGCRTLRNMLVTPYGSAERRPGLIHVAGAKALTDGNRARKVRLIRFVFSSTVAYVCEFGHQYIRFFKDGAPVVSGDTVVEIATSYTESQLAGIHFVQCADVMTIVHEAHPVRELKRTGANAFTLAEKDWEFPPMLDPNLNDALTITPSGVSGNITLSASGNVFDAGNVGGYYQLQHIRQSNDLRPDFTGNTSTAAIEVYGYWTLTSHGTWSGTLKIQRSFDNGTTWQDFRAWSSDKDFNVNTSGEEEERGVCYRLTMTNYVASDTGTLTMCRCLFSNPDFVTTGIVKITAVSSATGASATVVQKLGGTTATHEWNEGAFSPRRGYPRTVAYYQERMIFGGTSTQPARVWGSKTGDWDNFLIGSKDDDALDFTLASDTVNAIAWMCQHDALVIGSCDSEWTLSASDAQSALSSSNFRVKRQSVYGSSAIAAQMVGETILFVQRGARKVREFVYTWEKDGYSSPDMTILADHITESGIVETALQQLPDSILWCVLGDGSVAALTYERDQEVVGWHKHTTNGNVLSVCVIPDGAQDQVYFAVERNGSVRVERMAPRNFTNIADAVYLDAAKTVTGTDLTAVTGLAHLEGLTVNVFADGAAQYPKTVVSGAITLDEPARKVTVGLAYESLLSPMPIELETQNGSTMLRRKIIGELRIRIYGTVGGECRAGDGAWQKIISRDVVEDDLDLAIVPKDEVVTVIPGGGYDKSTSIELKQAGPLPFNVTSLVAILDVSE